MKQNDADSPMETRHSARTLLIIGVITLGISLLTYYFSDGHVSSLWLLYIEGFTGGFVIAWVVKNLLLQHLENLALWKPLASVLIGGFIGMGAGQNLQFLLVSVPKLSALRHEDLSMLTDFHISSFFENLRNTYSLLYLALLALGMFIGIVVIRRILYIVTKWALDYKQ